MRSVWARFGIAAVLTGALVAVPGCRTGGPPDPSWRVGPEDWPCFRGPRGDGLSPVKGINKAWAQRPPRVLWKVPLGDGGCAGPSAACGRVFIVDHLGQRGIVRCLTLKSGQETWRSEYEDMDKPNYGFDRATPTVAGDRLYTISRRGRVRCLNAHRGTEVWSRDMVADFRGRRPKWDWAASPLVDAGRVIVCPGGPNAAVAALDRNTGATLWQGGGSDPPGYATPVAATLAGVKQYVVFTAANLVGVDAASGRTLWALPWKTCDGANIATPVLAGDALFITSLYGPGCALVRVDGKGVRIAWQNTEVQCHFSSPVLAKGSLFAVSEPGILVCLDVATGKPRWKRPGFEKGGLIAVDGVLLALAGATGDVVMVAQEPSAYRELGRIRPLGGRSWTAPVLCGRSLLVRNGSALACVDLGA